MDSGTPLWAFLCAGARKNAWIRAPPIETFKCENVAAYGTSVVLNTSLTLCMEIVFPGGGGSGRSPFESAAPGEGLEACGVVGI